MDRFLNANLQKLLSLLLIFALGTNCLLGACTSNNRATTNNQSAEPSNTPPPELLEGYAYSWVRDTNFSNLNTDDQLNLINTAYYNEGFQAQFHAIGTAPNEDIYVSGTVVYGTVADINNDTSLRYALIVRYDKNLRYVDSFSTADFIAFYTLGIDKEGFIFVEGTGYGNNTIIKLDCELIEINRQEVLPMACFRAIAFTTDNCLLMCGLITTNPNGFGDDAIIVKYNTNLELIDYVTWNDGVLSSFDKLAVSSDSSIFVVGSIRVPYVANSIAVLCKYNSNLELLDTTIKSEGLNDTFVDLTLGLDDSVYAVYDPGYVEDDPGLRVIKYTSALVEVCVSSSIEELLNSTGSPQYNWPFLSSIVTDPKGLFYCIGKVTVSTNATATQDYVFAIIIDSNLSVLNVSLCPAERGVQVAGACLSGNADVYVSGYYMNYGLAIDPTGALIIK